MTETKKEIINVPYFTQCAWDYMYADSELHCCEANNGKRGLLEIAQKWSWSHYLHTIFREDIAHPDLRVIVLDEEFVDWMKKHQNEKTDASIEKYINIKRSNKEAFRLIEKNGLVEDYLYMAIPIIIINQKEVGEETRYILSSKTIDIIHDCLQDIYKDCDICVGRQLFTMIDFKENKHMFDEIVNMYFHENTILMKDFLFAQDWSEKPRKMHAMFVPFALQYIHKSPVFTYEQLYKTNPFHPEYVGLDKFMTDTEGEDYEDVATINEGIDRLIQKDLKGDRRFVFVDYNLKNIEEIPRYARNMKKVWEVADGN